MDTRRQHKRIPLKGDKIRVEIMTETKAKVSDLSNLGIGVKAPKRLRPGSPCTVTIRRNGSLMILQGTALWERSAGWSVKQGGNVDAIFSAGIRFDEAPADLMARACGGECDSERAVRVRPSGLTVLLSYAESLNVIKLSYGGLLAESLNPMKYGDENSVRLFLPGSPEPIKCMGRVTSCEPVKHELEKKYYVGLEFVAMDDAQAEQLKAYILMRSAI